MRLRFVAKSLVAREGRDYSPEMPTSRPVILVSRPLPLAPSSPEWSALAKLAKVQVGQLRAHPQLKRATGVITLVSDRVDSDFLDQAPHLKVVANYAVGCDNIDLQAARSRGVIVCNTPDVLSNATAELTIGLFIAACRRFPEGTGALRTRTFSGIVPTYLLGRELSGARLGIIGMGRIGSCVAEKARALGMTVDHHNGPGKGLPLPTLLATSDFVSIHCPLTASTRGLIGSRELRQMKKGSFLINTARGEILDESALLKALGKTLAGAALDVFQGEPKLRSELRSHPRVFVLPHLGSATIEARAAMARLAVSAVTEVLAGRIPSNRVG